MIDFIHLRHFKCFEELDLPLKPLTLLTGFNAGGKSSVIQALLLLKQSRSAMRFPGQVSVCLNGIDVDLGTVGDVMDERTARGYFSIGFSAGGRRLNVKCLTEVRDALVTQVESMLESDGTLENPVKTWPEDDREPWGQLSRLLHVPTERMGPRETYGADTGPEENSCHLGPRGEFTAWLLYQRRESTVAEELCRLDVPPTLLRQTEAWLGAFFPGAGLEVKRVDGANLVTLRLRTSAAGNLHRPQNVGFGLTYVLPIVVGALATEADGVLVVENPETHLHPSAQALIGKFLAQVAATGRQVIIESHSDHVLNGVRVAVKEKILHAESVQIHFFNRRPSPRDVTPHVISPILNQNGQIDNWPKGFFDQLEQDLEVLTTWD
ncbi:MAG: putative ATPase [Chthoniobacteraceae bacterium]|nr:putative ATPase [Chthoniobacteraceae bacterium]